jgi:two-component system, LytTR family, response regulator
MNAPLRALIVDDEALSRRRIRKMLSAHRDIEILDECADGRSAVTAIRSLHPDLVFLDIQMPELDGFGVVREIGPDQMPAVIFVTAYDRHALRAFEVHALDYLLKPFDARRLSAAITVARRRYRPHGPDDRTTSRLTKLLETLETRSRYSPRVLVKTPGRVLVVPVEDLDWAQAQGKHVHLHCGKTTHVSRQTLQDLESRLDPTDFVRIHRSTIVAVASIRELQPVFNGDYAVILRDGTELTLSRTFRERVQERLGRSL